MNISSNYKRKGIAIVWVVITIIMTLGIMALMLEGARIYLTSHQLQNTADAAALAGVRYVGVYHDPSYSNNPDTNAREVAKDYALQNPVLGGRQIQLDLNASNDPAGEIVIGRYAAQNAGDPPTFVAFTKIELADPNILPNALKVLDNMGNDSDNEPLPMVLGKIFGGQPKHLSRYAIAQISGASGAAIIALSPDGVGLLIRGNVNIAIDNSGAIQVNSSFDEAVDINGNPLDPEFSVISEINVVGDSDISDKILDRFDTIYDGTAASVTPNADYMPDPFYPNPDNPDDPNNIKEPSIAGISPTAPADGSTLKITGDTHVLQPGYYPGGIEITGGTTTLTSGIYQVNGTETSGGLSVNGGIITANEVMFHIVDGKLDISGNTQMTLTPPKSEDYKGISIFQSRTNYNDAEINGGGGLNLTGALYFPENHLRIEGNGDTIGTQLIADTIELHGTGLINIPYKGTPEIVNSSFLVE